MKLIKEIIFKTFIALIAISLLVGFGYQVKAATTGNTLEQQIKDYAENIDVNNISKEDILKVYDEIKEEYTNDELANIIEEHKEEIKKQGVDEELISAGTTLLRTTDEEGVRDIIENDIDIEEIQEKLEKGYTPNQIVGSVIQETPTEKIIEIGMKVLLANHIVKTVIKIIFILFIYHTIIRWIIYKKAKKHGWAAIIPFYRQIVMYKVCGLSPWLMLFWLLPVIGWLIMFVIAIMKRFCLSKEFGRGTLFGFGLLVLPTIFQSIIAFNSKIEYEGESHENN